MLLAMIAVYAVPAVLVEETEKKTMEALTLIASDRRRDRRQGTLRHRPERHSVPLLLVITRADPPRGACRGGRRSRPSC